MYVLHYSILTGAVNTEDRIRHLEEKSQRTLQLLYVIKNKTCRDRRVVKIPW
jgi:hypothetical protein